VVVLATVGGAWVNMRGALWRVANEQMRGATNDESLGAELVNRYLDDLRVDLQHNTGPKKYVDVQREGPPRFPGDRRIPVAEADDAPEVPDFDLTSEEDEPEAAPSEAPPSEQPASEPQPSEPQPPSPPPGDPYGSFGAPPRGDIPRYPYPYDRGVHFNAYVETIDAPTSESFYIGEALAVFEDSANYFTLKKKPVDAEIRVSDLPVAAQKLFLNGSRPKKWMNMINQVREDGGPAVKVHRGARARELSKTYAHRIVPSRWLE
jgi:hypothetical protein